MSQNSLTLFTRASQMLAEATTIQKAKELKDLAITAAEWAKRKGMGEEAVRYAKNYAFDAQIRMGELIEIEEKAGRLATRGNNPGTVKGGTAPGVPVRNTRQIATTASLGFTRKERAETKKLIALPEEKREEIKSGKKTVAAAIREVKKTELLKKTRPLPSNKYRVIYADPPWSYNDKCDSGSVQSGGAEKHYPSMTISQLCTLPISDLAEKNAVLFIWTTSPLLEETFPVINAWGFEYKTSFVWDKIKHNMGHYNSVRHEFLLVCTRGSCTPDNLKLFDSVQSIERKAHSEKPDEFRKIIDTLYTEGKKIELFSRKKVSGWEYWGTTDE